MADRLNSEKQGLKLAARDLVRAVGGGEAGAGFCRVSQQRLSEYGSINGELFMPADVVLDLEAVTRGEPGHPHVTRYLARSAGFGLVPLPELGAVSTDWHDHIGGLAEEAGDITRKICVSLADDGRVTAREVKVHGLLADAEKLLTIAVALRAALAQAADDPG